MVTGLSRLLTFILGSDYGSFGFRTKEQHLLRLFLGLAPKGNKGKGGQGYL